MPIQLQSPALDHPVQVSFALYVADCWASVHGAASVSSPTSVEQLRSHFSAGILFVSCSLANTRSWLYQAKHWWRQVTLFK